MTTANKDMKNTKDADAVGIESTALFGCPVPLSPDLPTEEGHYLALQTASGYREPVKIRYSHYRHCLVVDVCGQDVDQSEELWRYKGSWLWSERIEHKPNVQSEPRSQQKNT
jgi:hypothetical protein